MNIARSNRLFHWEVQFLFTLFDNKFLKLIDAEPVFDIKISLADYVTSTYSKKSPFRKSLTALLLMF